ncbi:MAG TPA: hypothetical protein V6C89_09615 [Drouetiella sp.]
MSKRFPQPETGTKSQIDLLSKDQVDYESAYYQPDIQQPVIV